MLIAPSALIVRMVFILLGYALAPIADSTFGRALPGVRPDDLYKLALGGLHTHMNADTAKWLALDASECDASHEPSDVMFASILLPGADVLRRTFCSLQIFLQEHWRSRSLVLRQKVELFGKWPSGISSCPEP